MIEPARSAHVAESFHDSASPAPRSAAIWDPQTRYRIWFEIERTRPTPGGDRRHPQGSAKTIWAKQTRQIDIRGSTRSSAEVKHDVIAFLTHLAEIIGPERASCTRA